MYIAVLDGGPGVRSLITELCREYLAQNSLYAEILGFARPDSLLDFVSRHDTRVVFVSSAFLDAARVLRSGGYDRALILLAPDMSLCQEAFDLGADYYLASPIDDCRFKTAMERCGHLLTRDGKFLSIIAERLPVSILLKNIVYIEVLGRTSIIHTVKKSFKSNISLIQIEKLLDDNFLRCYRSYIVNLDWVVRIFRGHFVMKGDINIPISREYRREIKDRYIRHMLGSQSSGTS